MRFGLTAWERQEKRLEQLIREHLGVTKFAWRPVQLHDGSWLWGEYYVACRNVHWYASAVHADDESKWLRFSSDQAAEYQRQWEKAKWWHKKWMWS